MNICPEGEFRGKLTEGEFWDYVLKNVEEVTFTFSDDGSFIDDITLLMNQPCTVCGEAGACGYDSEGRPMIHSFTEEDEEDERGE